VERLEHDADGAAAKPRQRILIEPRQILAGDLHRADARPLQAGQQHQQRRLARARRPEDRGRAASRERKVEAAQHLDLRRAVAQCEVNLVEHDDGREGDIGQGGDRSI
jgi:hypothetical protein